MRLTYPLLSTVLLLTACVALPLQIPSESTSSSSSSSSLPSLSSDFPVEIEEFSSSSVATGTGALVERVAARGMLEFGRANAPLVLMVFTNYSCDYCEEFMRDMLPRLESDFMMSGKLRIQFVIVPLKKYPNSVLEASSLLCATVLEKGQVMHEALRNASLRDRTSLLALSKKLKLPTKQFTTCLNAKETKSLLAEQQAFINEHDMTLIPAFFIGEERKIGLPSYADLRGWIRERLAD